jgi:hypothetical protein
MSEPLMKQEFPGNPRLYLRIAVFSSIFIGFWIYGGTALIQYLWNGSTTLMDWKPALGAVLFIAWYARYAYRWMMRGDAQWGSGSGWVLKECKVKLPELRS